MSTSVSASRTVIIDPRDTDNPVFDEIGSPLIGGPTQAILDAIHALHAEVRKMSGTVTQVEEDVAALMASNAKMTTDLDAIKAALLAAVPPVGTIVTQATVDALHAAVGVTASNTAEADAMVPASEPPTPAP